MILLSNAGSHTFTAARPSDTIAIGTTDGVAILKRENGRWRVAHTALPGIRVSAVTVGASGTLFAATHYVGVARSRDGGINWEWCNRGVDHHDLWSAKAGRLNGRAVVGIGALPANVYLSYDDGDSWAPLPALRGLPSIGQWTFPPPPHVGHVKDIAFDGDRLFVASRSAAACSRPTAARASSSCPSSRRSSSATSTASCSIPSGPIASSSPTASSA